MRNILIFLNVLLVCSVALAYAENQSTEGKKRFSNETSISLVNTTGNTDTLSLAGKNEMKYLFNEKWSGSWFAGAIYNEADGIKETERYFTDLRADYSINDRWYAYGLGSWFQDKFSGFDHRFGIGPGLGYRFLIGPTHLKITQILKRGKMIFWKVGCLQNTNGCFRKKLNSIKGCNTCKAGKKLIPGN